MESTYLVDNFVSVVPGEPFRLFPFGRIVKNGKVREVTRALAEKFRLPHFKPPIKLGSHDDTTPAGGFIIGLEVREDGLYAIPEWNDSGSSSLLAGSYRYHSPEIIWEGGFENPTTGELINGPLIVGDALLHTPHLGEATALYSVEPKNTKDGDLMTENVTIPVSFWEKLTARLFEDPKHEPEPAPQAAPPKVDEYAAKVESLTAQIAQMEAERAQMEADKAHAVKVDAFAAQFKATAVEGKADLFGILAKLDEADAAILTQELKALAEQAKLANLGKDIGGSGDSGNAVDRYNAAVKAKMDAGMKMPEAINAVAAEDYELVKAARKGGA